MMSIQRCPECGIRLKNSYCDICMKRVPFAGIPDKQSFQHIDGSSAHRMEEGHACVSFGEKKKKPTWTYTQKKVTSKVKKPVTIVAIVFALISLLPGIFGMVQDIMDTELTPEFENIVIGDVPQIETRELYNENGITITADYAALYYDEYTLFLTVLNESEEDVEVFTELLSVNGYMQEYGFYAAADKGESVQETLTLYSRELERDGIEEIAEIAFYLNIYPEDYSDVARSELIVLETDVSDDYAQAEFLDGWQIYSGEDVSMRLVNYGDIGDNAIELCVYMENLSEETVSVYSQAILINGEETDGYLWNTLLPDTRSNRELYLYETGIDSLDQLKEITFQLVIEHVEHYEILSSRTETVTFTVEN